MKQAQTQHSTMRGINLSTLSPDLLHESAAKTANTNTPSFKAFWRTVRSQLIHYAFYELFDVVAANTPQLLEEAHRVRYQVFCVENKGYENPSDHPHGMEKDRYDDHSSHALVMHRSSGKAVGTVRVILPNPKDLMDSFPIQRLCDHPLLKDPNHIARTCEISRLALKREFQVDMVKICNKKFLSYLKHDKKYNQGAFQRFLMTGGLRMAPMGLVRGMFMQALRHECLEGFGVMEPRVISNLKKVGFVMEPIGPATNYHGLRVPFKFNISQIFENGFKNSFDTWNVVTNKGELHDLARNIEFLQQLQHKDYKPMEVAV